MNALTTSLFEQAKDSKFNYSYNDEEKEHFRYLLEMKEKADKYNNMVNSNFSDTSLDIDQKIIFKNLQDCEDNLDYYRNTLKTYEFEKANNISFSKPSFNRPNYYEKTKEKILELETTKKRLESLQTNNTCVIV